MVYDAKRLRLELAYRSLQHAKNALFCASSDLVYAGAWAEDKVVVEMIGEVDDDVVEMIGEVDDVLRAIAGHVEPETRIREVDR